MSDSDRPSSLSGSKRAASPTNAAAEAPAQRPRHSEAAAAYPPAAVRPLLSAAQRCAADTLTLVFGFIKWTELLCALRTCRAWYSAAAKEKPRGLWFNRPNLQLASLCTSSSPLRHHIARVIADLSSSRSTMRLTQLSQLPQLTALDVYLNAAALSQLINKKGGGALVQLKAAFPPKLRDLTLCVTDAHSTAVCQLLLDALPAMKELDRLSLTTPVDVQPDPLPSLSLQPLLQLPRLTKLKWSICKLAASQLLTIKQIATLQHFNPGEDGLTAAQLSALCRPPHRLQRLQEVDLSGINIDATTVTELASLPALTAFSSRSVMHDAFAFLPRIVRLQQLSVTLESWLDAAQQAERSALLVAALPACAALTELTVAWGECSESFGSQLMQAVPRLRTLRLERCSLPSLRFLRHAPHLKELSLIDCDDVRLGHVVGICSFAPQLERLSLDSCRGLQLDEAEQRMLTPPHALGLLQLREFTYSQH